MNNMLKRLLSLAMAVVLVMSCGVMPVAAAEDEGGEHTHTWVNGVCECTAECTHEGAESGETPATCTSEGEKTFNCGICGIISTETIPATEHTYVDGKCVCGADEPHVHTYDEGTVTTEATCGAPGVLTKTCACNETVTETIAATGLHSYENGRCTVCTAVDPDYVAPTEETKAVCDGSDLCAAETHEESCPNYDWCAALGCTEEAHHADCPWGPCTLTEGCQLVKGHELLGAPCDVVIAFDAGNITTVDALNAALADGSVTEITLGGDIEATDIVAIGRSVTINGSGHTLTSSANRVINVSTTGEVVIKNLKVVSTCTADNDERGINVIQKACDLTLDNVDISGVSHYAINVATSAPSGTKVTIRNSSSSTGYSALNIAGSSRTILVEDSELTGNNPYSNSPENAFGVITFNADASGNTVTVEGGKISATSSGNEQAIVCMCSDKTTVAAGNTVSIIDTELSMNGEGTCYLLNGAATNNVTMPMISADSLAAEGHKQNADGRIVDIIDDETALRAALNAGGTVTLDDSFEVSGVIEVDKPATLNLNNNTITAKNADDRGFIKLVNGCNEFTLNAGENGKIIAEESAKGILDMHNAGTVTVNGGTYQWGASAFSPFKFQDAATKLVLNDVNVETNVQVAGLNTSTQELVVDGGTFKTTSDKGNDYNYFLFYVNGGKASFDNVTVETQYIGAIEAEGSDVTVTDSHITVTGVRNAPYQSSAVAVSGGGELTVESGSYKSDANAAICMNSGGTLNLEGGSFETNGGTYAAVHVDATTGKTSVVNISDGTYAGTKPVAVGDQTGSTTLTITGGTFADADVSAYVPVGYKQDSTSGEVKPVDMKEETDVVAPAPVVNEQLQQSATEAEKEVIDKVTTDNTVNTATEVTSSIQTAVQEDTKVQEAIQAVVENSAATDATDVQFTVKIVLDDVDVAENGQTTLSFEVEPVVQAVKEVKVEGTEETKTETVGEPVPVTELTNPITFRLPMPNGTKGRIVNIKHEHEEGNPIFLGAFTIQGDGEGENSTNCYVQLESANFSEWEAVILPENVTSIDAEVNGVGYPTLEEALQKVEAGQTIKLLKDITITEDWDCRNVKVTKAIIIDGNGKTIKFTGKINDAANHTAAFRFEAPVTVKNLTIDMSSATPDKDTRMRAISTSASLTVENCDFIGNSSLTKTRAIIFGEGAGTNIGNVSLTVTGSKFTDWGRGITDNENAEDAKSASISGSTFTNADVYVSAKENVSFTGNNVNSSDIDIRAYTTDSNLAVNASGNTLTGDSTANVKDVGTANVQNDFDFTNAVAAIGETQYGDLQKAIEAADGDTVKLLKDVEGKFIVASVTSVNLDLNGYSIKNAEDDDATSDIPADIEVNGILHVYDSNHGNNAIEIPVNVSDGTFFLNSPAAMGDLIVNGGEAFISGGTVNGAITTNGNGTVEITGGNILGEMNGNIIVMGKFNGVLNQAVFAKDPTKFCEKGYYGVKNGDYWYVAEYDYMIVNGSKEYVSDLGNIIDTTLNGGSDSLLDITLEKGNATITGEHAVMNGQELLLITEENKVTGGGSVTSEKKMTVNVNKGAVETELPDGGKITFHSDSITYAPRYVSENGYGRVIVTKAGESKATYYYLDKGASLTVTDNGKVSVTGKYILGDKDEPYYTISISQDGHYDNRHYLGKDGDMTITCNGFYGSVDQIWITGEEYGEGRALPVFEKGAAVNGFKVVEGSTIVTLSEEYLDSLEEGDYKINFKYKDHDNGEYISQVFKIRTKSSGNADTTNPKTGDTILMPMFVMTISAAALAVLLIDKKKRV